MFLNPNILKRVHTFMRSSALSNPISMLMISKPVADLFFWCTPLNKAQRVYRGTHETEDKQRQTVGGKERRFESAVC